MAIIVNISKDIYVILVLLLGTILLVFNIFNQDIDRLNALIIQAYIIIYIICSYVISLN